MVDFDAILRKDNEVKRRKAAIEKLWARATDTTIKMSDMPKGQGTGKKMENAIVNMADIEADCSQAEEELAKLRQDLRRQMRVLKKWQHRDIIRKRFIEGKTIGQVMDEIGYEWTQTHRYLTEAKAIINSK